MHALFSRRKKKKSNNPMQINLTIWIIFTCSPMHANKGAWIGHEAMTSHVSCRRMSKDRLEQ